MFIKNEHFSHKNDLPEILADVENSVKGLTDKSMEISGNQTKKIESKNYSDH